MSHILDITMIGVIFLIIGVSGVYAIPPEVPGSDEFLHLPRPAKSVPHIGPYTGAPWEDYRLPLEVIPTDYELYLNPNLDDLTINGKVNILINVTKPRDNLYLHSMYTKYDKVSKLYNGYVPLGQEDDATEAVNFTEQFAYEPNQFLVVKPETMIEAGTYTWHLEFTSSLYNEEDPLNGFYLSTYTDENGEERKVAATQFEPTHARMAFPCFDEPSIKSHFTVTLVRPSGDGYIALANMDVKSETANSPSAGLTEVAFNTTPMMVSYLNCFVVCDFKHYTVAMHGEKPFSVYVPNQYINNAKYPAESGKAAIDFYIDYVGVDFPLPKEDNIGIPSFGAGAMENWGLITYKMHLVEADPETAPTGSLSSIASVMCHEIAHQWFGDLVTCGWWSDLWLNEGSATFWQAKCQQAIAPEFETWIQFTAGTMRSPMTRDGTENSHPIINQCATPEEIWAMFDNISYNKGGSILRQTEWILGVENFKKAINSYLVDMSYQSAHNVHLFPHFQKFAPEGVDMLTLMDTWTLQKGLPVVTVEDMGAGDYKLTQSRWLNDASTNFNKTESPFGYQWHIPVSYKTNLADGELIVMDQDTLTLNLGAGVEWVKLNPDQNGYYRVNYPQPMWDAISNAITENHEAVGLLDRVHLLNDMSTFIDAGLYEYDMFLEFTQTLHLGRPLPMWTVAVDTLDLIVDYLYDTPSYQKLQEYISGMAYPCFDDVKWEHTGPYALKKWRSSYIAPWACRLGHPDCLAGAFNDWSQYINDDAHWIHPDNKDNALNFGIQGSPAQQDDLMALYMMYEIGGSGFDNHTLLDWMMRVDNPTNIKTLLTHTIEGDMSYSDFFYVWNSISHKNEAAIKVVWDIYRDNYESLVARFGLDDMKLGDLIVEITSRFNSEKFLTEMSSFFELYPDAGVGQAARDAALKHVQTRIDWLKLHYSPIEMWLARH